MLYFIELLSEAAKAAGRIAAGFALLHYRIFFKMIKICLILQISVAVWRLAVGFKNWMFFPVSLVALGSLFIVWTHQKVGVPGSRRQVIISGPFAVVRHPMYSGWCLVAIGAGWLGQHWSMGMLAVFQTLFMFSVSCAEDEENARIFGDAYIRYGKSVWMMGVLPGLIRCLIRQFITMRPEASVNGKRNGE